MDSYIFFFFTSKKEYIFFQGLEFLWDIFPGRSSLKDVHSQRYYRLEFLSNWILKDVFQEYGFLKTFDFFGTFFPACSSLKDVYSQGHYFSGMHICMENFSRSLISKDHWKHDIYLKETFCTSAALFSILDCGLMSKDVDL